MPGKGKALFARFDISTGKRILHEEPLFTIANQTLGREFESDIAAKLKTLSKSKQRQFLSLHNNFPGKYPFGGIMKTNALPCGPNSAIGGVYSTTCLINHSCLPNAHNNWNDSTHCETIHAIRDIKCGEEITISYDQGQPFDSRRSFLKAAFGFECNCGLCSSSPPDILASDSRRLRIQTLDDEIGDPVQVMTNPAGCLAACHQWLRILQEEYKGAAGALIARLYYDAFQICIMHGDQARASVFAKRGYESRIACEGEDSPATQNIKNLVANPAAHRNYGTSRKWKTTKEQVPKGLDADEFEHWLWKQRFGQA